MLDYNVRITTIEDLLEKLDGKIMAIKHLLHCIEIRVDLRKLNFCLDIFRFKVVDGQKISKFINFQKCLEILFAGSLHICPSFCFLNALLFCCIVL